jgi:hypothetical protein
MGILGVAGAETCVAGDGIYFGGTGGTSGGNKTNSFDGCAWASESNLGRSVKPVCAGGISSDAIQGAGSQDGASSKFNGSSWASITAFPYERGEATGGDGDSDDALLAGGYGHASGSTNSSVRRQDTHTWNGSSWSSAADLPWSETYQARTVDGHSYGGDAGGGMIVGGAYGSGTQWNGYSWIWNGSSWSTASSAHSGNYSTTNGSGNASAFTAGFGHSGSFVTATEKWNGSSWSSAGSSNSGHQKGASGGSGSATGSHNIIICSGQKSGVSNSLDVDRYDGTAWAVQANCLFSGQEGGAGFRG